VHVTQLLYTVLQGSCSIDQSFIALSKPGFVTIFPKLLTFNYISRN